MEREIWQPYKGKGLQVIGVALWAEGDPFDRAKDFAQKHKLTYSILVDDGKGTDKKYGVRGVPTTVVVTRDGRIYSVIVGADLEAIEAAVKAVLK